MRSMSICHLKHLNFNSLLLHEIPYSRSDYNCSYSKFATIESKVDY